MDIIHRKLLFQREARWCYGSLCSGLNKEKHWKNEKSHVTYHIKEIAKKQPDLKEPAVEEFEPLLWAQVSFIKKYINQHVKLILTI